MGIIMCKSGPLGEKSILLSERKVLCWNNWLNAADISVEGRIEIRFFQSLKSSMNKIIFDEVLSNPIEKNLVDLLSNNSRCHEDMSDWKTIIEDAMFWLEWIHAECCNQWWAHRSSINNISTYNWHESSNAQLCLYHLEVYMSGSRQHNIPLPVVTFDHAYGLRLWKLFAVNPNNSKTY